MNTTQMYDAQADSMNVRKIASNDNNRNILRRIKINSIDEFNTIGDDIDILYIQSQIDEHGYGENNYVPEGAKDMGWLGYFVGVSEHLEQLHFGPLTPTSGLSIMEILKPFFSGVANNKSITKLNFYGMDLLDGKIFTMMCPFFENNNKLSHITITDCQLGDDGWRLLALAIGSSKHKSLQKVLLLSCNVSDEGSVDIITALSMHPHLHTLNLVGNRLNKLGCKALATLLRHSCNTLGSLNLANNEINDEGVDALVPALKNDSNSLHQLWLSGNPSITSRGWQKLATVLESPNSKLKELYIVGNNVGDEAVAVLASALVNNRTLMAISIRCFTESSFNEEGWDAFSSLLCNSSSVNATFLSNHTLNELGCLHQNPLQPLLTLNKREDKKEVAMIKILQHHNEFDMTPFFEWEFKVLPLMINWFEKASSITMPQDYEPNIRPRKLSSIYQFVRGMPLLYVETRLRKELEDIKAAQVHIEEERARLDQQKQSNEERKRSILERLGHNV